MKPIQRHLSSDFQQGQVKSVTPPPRGIPYNQGWFHLFFSTAVAICTRLPGFLTSLLSTAVLIIIRVSTILLLCYCNILPTSIWFLQPGTFLVGFVSGVSSFLLLWISNKLAARVRDVDWVNSIIEPGFYSVLYPPFAPDSAWFPWFPVNICVAWAALDQLIKNLANFAGSPVNICTDWMRPIRSLEILPIPR